MGTKPQILAIDSQRNGVGGEHFTTAIIRDDDERGGTERYLIVYVPERGENGVLTGVKEADGQLTFVNSLDRAAENDLSSHWRGDRMFRRWFPYLRAAEIEKEITEQNARATEADARAAQYEAEGNTEMLNRNRDYAQLCRDMAATASRRLAALELETTTTR